MEPKSNVPTRGPQLLLLIALFPSISGIFVFTRLYARKRISKYTGIDDWLILAGWAASLGDGVVGALQVQHGIGKHIYDITLPDIIIFLKLIWVDEIVYPSTLAIVKMSILFFYLRMFPDQLFQRLAIGTIVFLIVAAGATSLACIFQCLPIKYSWALPPLRVGHCVNIPAISLYAGILNLVSDVVVLCLPIKYLWDLPIEMQKKLRVIALLSVGLVSCIASAIRISIVKALEKSPDPTWDAFGVVLWSSIEIHLTIITASVPGIAPLISHLYKKLPTRDHKRPGLSQQVEQVQQQKR